LQCKADCPPDKGGIFRGLGSADVARSATWWSATIEEIGSPLLERLFSMYVTASEQGERSARQNR
jgi:hypothetical protein